MTTTGTTSTSTTSTMATTAAEQPWAGTGTLLRLNLRLDRVRLTIWTLAVGLTVWGSVVALQETFPTAESLQVRASLMASPSAVLMTGPAFGLDNYTFGTMLANELSLWLLIAAALMSILLAVRHTRAEEEAGRTETVRAMAVGRYAGPLSALVTVALANLLVGSATTLALLGTGQDGDSSVAFGLAVGLTGLVFGAVAAVAAQITEHARAATGMAIGVLGAAFLARGVGDVIDNQGSWLSWTSPLAWAQQTRLFVDLRWWPLALSGVAVLVLLVLAVALARRRDVGAGLRAPAPGPGTATARLLSPEGLAWRLLRGSFWACALGVLFFGVAMGALADSFDEEALAQMPALQEWIQLNPGGFVESFSATLLVYLVIVPLAFGTSAVLRLRAEESEGRVDSLLVTGSGRLRLLLGWLTTVVVLVTVIVVVAGLSLGAGVLLATGEGSWVGELTLAALAYLPATFLVVAVPVALLGLVPRAASWAWALVTGVVFVAVLGQLLDLPGWLRDLSPLEQTGLVPSVDVQPTTLAVLAALALVVAVVGCLGLRRRDVGTV